jgi:hypothetical protein
MAQRRSDVGDDRWALEAAQRANGNAHRLIVPAARGRLKDGKIVGVRRAAVLGLEDGEPRRKGLRARRRYITAENAKSAEKTILCDLCELRG